MMKFARRQNLEEAVNLAKRRAWHITPHAFVSFTILDGKKKNSTMHLNFPDNVDIGVLRTNFIPTTATLLNAIITGKIINAGIGIEVDISGATIRSTPDANADVEEGALFTGITAIGSDTTFRVPTIDEAMFNAGTQNINFADTDMAAFILRVINGQTVGLVNVSPSDNRGEDVTDITTGVDSFQSSRH